MTAPTTKDVDCVSCDVELIADPYPTLKAMRGRCTTTIQIETV